jgi:hypothetical protein
MQDKSQILQLAQYIVPTEARNYAKSRGWEPVAVKGRLWVFRHSEQRLRQLIIPKDQEDDAYAEAIAEVIQRIADDEKRSPLSVTSDLLMPNSDILRFRVTGENAMTGTLLLEDAQSLFEGAKRAILAAACSVVNKTTHHLRMSRSEAEEMLKACKLGQTEYGSFAAKIACPLDAVETDSPLFDTDTPFVRKATILLASACSEIVDSIENDTVGPLMEKNSQNPIITSNLCDALIRMHGSRDKGKIGLDITWASNPSIPIPDVPNRAVFKSEYFHIIDQIGKSLRPKNETEDTQELLGTVETLNGDAGEDGRRSGEVILSLLLPDEGAVRAKVMLGAEEYADAVKAHEMGRSYIMVKGVLYRDIRIGHIKDIECFKLVDPGHPQ